MNLEVDNYIRYYNSYFCYCLLLLYYIYNLFIIITYVNNNLFKLQSI